MTKTFRIIRRHKWARDPNEDQWECSVCHSTITGEACEMCSEANPRPPNTVHAPCPQCTLPCNPRHEIIYTPLSEVV
jgi:hypothetical protein